MPTILASPPLPRRNSGGKVSLVTLVLDQERAVAKWERCNTGVETNCGIGGFANAAIQGGPTKRRLTSKCSMSTRTKMGNGG